jgi:hypothetical protein
MEPNNMPIASLNSSRTRVSTIKQNVRLCGRLCGLVVRVFGYRSGGRVRFPALPEKNVVGLDRGPLSLVSTTEELLDREVAAPV